MGGKIAARLKELNITLPPAASAVANYMPYVFSGNLLFISGQLPMNGQAVTVQGHLGSGLKVPDGQKAARLCALNILAQAEAALDGDLDQIVRMVRLGVFVACTPDFYHHAQVANGASDVLGEILGEAGRHARAAVGVTSLPREAAVEVEAVIEVSAK